MMIAHPIFQSSKQQRVKELSNIIATVAISNMSDLHSIYSIPDVYFSAPSHPIPPPPYDSQGETYRLINDTEEDNSSPMENTPLENGLQNSFRYPRAKRRLNGNPYPRELKKFLAASIFMALNFLATTVSLSVVHERVPKYEPLPDIILDFFKYQDWGLTASEVLLSIQVATAIMVCIFHKHR